MPQRRRQLGEGDENCDRYYLLYFWMRDVTWLLFHPHTILTMLRLLYLYIFISNTLHSSFGVPADGSSSCQGALDRMGQRGTHW